LKKKQSQASAARKMISSLNFKFYFKKQLFSRSSRVRGPELRIEMKGGDKRRGLEGEDAENLRPKYLLSSAFASPRLD